MASIKYGEEIEKTEEENLKDIPSLKLIYERDLLDNLLTSGNCGQNFQLSWIENSQSKVTVQKSVTAGLRDTIINYDEVYNYFKTQSISIY